MQENNWPSLCNCRGQIDNAKFEQTREENCHPTSSERVSHLIQAWDPRGRTLPCEEKGRETRQQWTTAPPTPTSFETFQKYLKAFNICPIPCWLLIFSSKDRRKIFPSYLSIYPSFDPPVRRRSVPFTSPAKLSDGGGGGPPSQRPSVHARTEKRQESSSSFSSSRALALEGPTRGHTTALPGLS